MGIPSQQLSFGPYFCQTHIKTDIAGDLFEKFPYGVHSKVNLLIWLGN